MHNDQTVGSSNVDSTCCPITQPAIGQEKFYCVKCCRHVLKYEVVVHRITGLICWVFGGFGGAVHDLTIARSALVNQLQQGEKIFADKGYRGENCFLTPFAGRWDTLSDAERTWNKFHTNMHFEHIERVNRRLKIWNCLHTAWRHDLDKHHIVFKIVASITNIEFVFHPLNGTK